MRIDEQLKCVFIPFFFVIFLLSTDCCCEKNVRTKSDDMCQNNMMHIVNLDVEEQEFLIEQARNNCFTQIINEPKILANQNGCGIFWDTLSCWPATQFNKTAEVFCPNFVNRFNTKQKAFKRCLFDANMSRPYWEKSNYSLCIKTVECDSSCKVDNHMSYMLIIRVCGFLASMVSLLMSILILLRPKLRCPRNYVHINLFAAFVLRTVLIMLADSINKTQKISTKQKQLNEEYIACRIIMLIYRYSGSVYQVAISAEALYLVLLLKFPYYSEKNGCKFCIIASWVLPFFWLVPWVIAKAVFHNYWCWQTESDINLILKIPNSLLLIFNICCACFIIRILYSKMCSRNLSREKLIKYRRLAKSILILIPIFGLHFIFFAWMPYAHLIHSNLGDCFEIAHMYIETFFNAFQGLVVSITTCLIHGEARIECILFFCDLLRKFECISSIGCISKCVESDYIRQLRFSYYENRHGVGKSCVSVLNNNGASTAAVNTRKKRRLSNTTKAPLVKKYSLDNDDELAEKKLVSTNEELISLNLTNNNGERKASTASVNMSITSTKSEEPDRCFSFLFSNQRNDFYSDTNSSNKRKLKKSKTKLSQLRAKKKQRSLAKKQEGSIEEKNDESKKVRVISEIEYLDDEKNLTQN